MTIVAVFVPVSFMPGIAGQYFRSFGITVAVAGVVLPVGRASDHADDGGLFPAPSLHRGETAGTILAHVYAAVTWSVRHYLITVMTGLLLFAASIRSLGLLSKGFLPGQDSARSQLAIELPPGSRLSDTERVTEEIVKRLRARPENQERVR